MRIGNEYLQQKTVYSRNSSRTASQSFSDLINKAKSSPTHERGTSDSYVSSNGCQISGIYTKNSIAQRIEFPIETERYTIEDAADTEGVPAYVIRDKQLGRSVYIREDQLAIQKDERTGMKFLINPDQPFCGNVTVTPELKSLLEDLSQKRKLDLQEIPLQGGLIVNQDPKTGLNYLSIKGNEAKGVSIIFTSEKDMETLNRLIDEFQTYAVCTERETAGLYALLEISGNLKRETDGFVFLTPDGIHYVPYDGDPEKAWDIDMPGSSYSAARAYLASGSICSDPDAWMQKLQGIQLHDGTAQKADCYRTDEWSRYFILE